MIVEAEQDMEDEMSLYSSTQRETFRDVKINPELTEQQKLEVIELVEIFQEVFTYVPGLTTLCELAILHS